MSGKKDYQNKQVARKVDPPLMETTYHLKEKPQTTIDDVKVQETPHRDGSVWHTFLENYKYCPFKDCKRCKIVEPTLYAYCHSGYTVWDKKVKR